MSSIFLGQIYLFWKLGCKVTENYDGFENISLFFLRIVKQSKKVRHPTCLETNFILILNFPQISAKYAPKYQKWIIFQKFKQFWWIFNILYVLCLCLIIIIFCLLRYFYCKFSIFFSFLKKILNKHFLCFFFDILFFLVFVTAYFF